MTVALAYLRPPQMPELLDIRRGTVAGTGAPGAVAVAGVHCRWVPTTRLELNAVPALGVVAEAWVDVPGATDIRDGRTRTWNVGAHQWDLGFDWLAADVVEVPAGSGAFFTVLWVEDRYRGFGGFYRRGYVSSGV